LTSFITGLPRSRTYWFAEYFNGKHEVLNGCKSKEDFYERAEGYVNCDSGLIISDWREHWPEAKTVIIHRNLGDVIDSLHKKLRVTGELVDFLYKQAIALDSIEGLHIPFNEINDRLEDICKFIGEEYKSDYSDLMIQKNLQLDEITGDVDSLMIWKEK